MLFLCALTDGWTALALFGAVWVAGGVWVARMRNECSEVSYSEED
jgi:hypothetical protein